MLVRPRAVEFVSRLAFRAAVEVTSCTGNNAELPAILTFGVPARVTVGVLPTFTVGVFTTLTFEVDEVGDVVLGCSALAILAAVTAIITAAAAPARDLRLLETALLRVAVSPIMLQGCLFILCFSFFEGLCFLR